MSDQTIDLATRIYGLLDSRATYNGDQFIAETARLIHEDRAAVAADRDNRIASLEAQLASARESLAAAQDVCESRLRSLTTRAHQLASAREEALREAIALVRKEVDKFRELAADAHDETRHSMKRDATTLRIYALEPLEALLTSPPKNSLGSCRWVDVEERLPLPGQYRVQFRNGELGSLGFCVIGAGFFKVCVARWLEVSEPPLPELPPPADQKEPL